MTFTRTSNVREYIKINGEYVNRILDQYLPPAEQDPSTLHSAMRYSVLAPGKRLRPILALSSYIYCGGKTKGENLPIHYAMAALEMVHTYSLIHDDLPCMDDDDLRRGIPTCHKKFGEAEAVLAGDALHDVAFHLLAQAGSTQTCIELAEALGTMGMIGGQCADVEAEGRDVTRKEVINIHTRKTGALIRCSVRLGAILANADKNMLKLLTVYGEKIGLAFQIIDDILDVEGNSELLGKNVGSDSKMKKATYPGVVGIVQARKDANKLIEDAVACFDKFDNNILKDLAIYIGQRNK